MSNLLSGTIGSGCGGSLDILSVVTTGFLTCFLVFGFVTFGFTLTSAEYKSNILRFQRICDIKNVNVDGKL